ncbi:MAG: hypothetical protein Q8P12_00605, partial [bacterium]|nr:hypothetical protein [bacterium]
MKTCFLLLGLAVLPLRAEIVDRTLAVVGDRVVTWSDVMAEANYQAFLNGRQPPDPAELDRKENWQPVLSRLVDQALLAQAQETFPFAPSEKGEAKRRLEEVRKQFPDGEAYRDALVRCKLTEAEL